MNAYRVAIRGIDPSNLWTESDYTVYVSAAHIVSAAKKVRAWARVNKIKKPKVREVSQIEGNVI